jgi:hypothetical protein
VGVGKGGSVEGFGPRRWWREGRSARQTVMTGFPRRAWDAGPPQLYLTGNVSPSAWGEPLTCQRDTPRCHPALTHQAEDRRPPRHGDHRRAATPSLSAASSLVAR